MSKPRRASYEGEGGGDAEGLDELETDQVEPGQADRAGHVDDVEALSPEEEFEAYRESLNVPIVCRRQGDRRDSYRVEVAAKEVERVLRKALFDIGTEVPEHAALNVHAQRGACFAWDIDSKLEVEASEPPESS